MRPTRCAPPPTGWPRPTPRAGSWPCSEISCPNTSRKGRMGVPAHADPYRAIDRQPDPEQYVTFLEARGSTPSQARLRRRFLRFCGIRPGWRVLEVGTGTGVLARDLAAVVGRRGRVVAVDPSRVLVAAARRLAREHGLDGRVDFRVGQGARLGFSADQFDCALAVTVLLHVPEATAVVRELARV